MNSDIQKEWLDLGLCKFAVGDTVYLIIGNSARESVVLNILVFADDSEVKKAIENKSAEIPYTYIVRHHSVKQELELYSSRHECLTAVYTRFTKDVGGAWIDEQSVENHPLPRQPLKKDKNGHVRFVSNRIVRFLLDSHPSIDMNELAFMPFSKEEEMQFAQLIGYSLNGYGELSYVSDESYLLAAGEARNKGWWS